LFNLKIASATFGIGGAIAPSSPLATRLGLRDSTYASQNCRTLWPSQKLDRATKSIEDKYQINVFEHRSGTILFCISMHFDNSLIIGISFCEYALQTSVPDQHVTSRNNDGTENIKPGYSRCIKKVPLMNAKHS